MAKPAETCQYAKQWVPSNSEFHAGCNTHLVYSRAWFALATFVQNQIGEAHRSSSEVSVAFILSSVSSRNAVRVYVSSLKIAKIEDTTQSCRNGGDGPIKFSSQYRTVPDVDFVCQSRKHSEVFLKSSQLS